MWPQISCPSIYNGTSSSSEHSSKTAYAEFMENCHSCMVFWTIIADEDMITLNEFVYLNCLKESKEFGYYKLVPWDRRSQLIVDLPSSFHYWKSRYFFMSGDSWETFSNDFWGDVPWLLRRWETPQLGMFTSYVTHFSFNITCFDCPF